MLRCGLSMPMVCIALFLLAACATPSRNVQPVAAPESAKLTTSPFEQLAFRSTGKTVYEDEGKFILIEDSKCVRHEGGESAATILQWLELPGYVNQGTVVLNGWDLRYLQGDREVNSVRADITHSKLVRNANSVFLVFEAEGKLEDQGRRDAFEFCVFYSGFGYDSAWLDAAVEGDYSGIEAVSVQSQKQGPVTTLENIGNKGMLKTHDGVAILPRGFDFRFENAFECEWRWMPCKLSDRIDYPLLQMAYNLSQTGTSPNLDGSPFWVTQTLFKSNEARTQHVKTRAALIRGRSVKVRADFLPLNPRSNEPGFCRKITDGVVRTQKYRITDLPYDYALPMLTGWDLAFECEQQNVQRAGVWIHDIRFDPASSSMEYKVSSILRDKDSIPSFHTTHRVSILGFNRIVPPAMRPSPELRIKIRE